MKVLLRLIGYVGVSLIAIAGFAFMGWIGGTLTLGTILITIAFVEAVLWNEHIEAKK